MEAGAHVWVYDERSEETWLFCEVTKKDPGELTVVRISAAGRPTGSPFTKPRKAGGTDEEDLYDGVELANVKTSNEEESYDDLISLVHLNEPAILHAVQERFSINKIYTWTGKILLAVNPFQKLPIYSSDILDAYRRDGLLRSQHLTPEKVLPPHIFRIADDAYRQMMNGQFKSQSILISGESGAGKTESTKLVMLYLTTLGSHDAMAKAGADEEEKNDLSMMEKVLQTNPILEAFGNAKTLRNDNSSRFGKFIELGFSRSGSLLGGKVDVYLLEKVRLGAHASGERNYHIFYQLLRGCSTEQHKLFKFNDGMTGGLELSNFFHYTGQGGAPRLRDLQDEPSFKFTLRSMRSLGWSDELIDRVLKLTAGILHIGQMKFHADVDDGGEVAVVSTTDTLQNVAELIGVDVKGLELALTQRILVTREKTMNLKLNVEKAMDARDGLAKCIYSALFDWIVLEVNKSIGWEDDAAKKCSTGVLDIFGFECFAENSFEQLCINYTNEALQQQFNKFVFKMEQIEYEEEGIDFSFITFPDNQDCLDLIQKKPTGILSTLDDQSRVANGNDKTFAQKLYGKFIDSGKKTSSECDRFHASKKQVGSLKFSIRHFAGFVEYTLETNWVEKNKDEVPLAAKKLFSTAISPLLRVLFPPDPVKQSTEKKKFGNTKLQSKTVAMQFKAQLNVLMNNIGSTDPHYIRCLKPNGAAKPKLITRRHLTEQLRYGGVLEAIRVSRMGFPVRMGHGQFFSHYRLVLPYVPERVLTWNVSCCSSSEVQNACTKFIDLIVSGSAAKSGDGVKESRVMKILYMQHQPPPLNFSKTDVQLGISKLFLRKNAHEVLEANRVHILSATVTYLQSVLRCHQGRSCYLLFRFAASYIQRVYRGHKGRERYWNLREDKAANLLTKNIRMLLVCKRYMTHWKGMRRFQIVYRVYVRKRNVATCRIQTVHRMTKEHYKFRRLKGAVVALQCAQRSKVARSLLAEYKKAAKDIGNLKEDNQKLKSEMASLKAMLKAQAQTQSNKSAGLIEIQERDAEISNLREKLTILETERDSLIKTQKETDKILQEERDQRRQLEKQFEEEKKSDEMPTGHSLARKTSIQTIQDITVITKMERELEHERRSRREADGEIVRLRKALKEAKENLDNYSQALPSYYGEATEGRDLHTDFHSPSQKTHSTPKSPIAVPKPSIPSPSILVPFTKPPMVSEEEESDDEDVEEAAEAALHARRTCESQDEAKEVPIAVQPESSVQEMSVPITTEVILVSKVNNAEVSTDKIKVESVPVVAEAALDATDSDHADESRRQPSDEVDMIVGFPVSSQKNKSTGAEAEEFNMEVETQNEAKKEEIIKDGNHVYETPKASSSAVVDVAGWGDKSLVDDTSDEEEDIPQNPIPVKEESTDLDETMNGSEAQEKAQEEAEEFKKIQEESVTPEVMSALRKLGVNEARNHPLFKFSDSSKSLQGSTSPSDYLPMIKQKSSKSFMESADKISRNKLGLTVDISSRNVMETQLRKSMYEFEEKMSTFRESLENGADTVIWQLESRISTAGEDEGDQFIIQNSHVTMKLVKRGEGLIMSVLTFTKGKGVFGNLMGKTDNFISDPLLIREILEIKAGCAGYTSAFLPTNSKARSKDNKNSSLFLTIKATSTPVASSRSYFIKLKTTEDRNTFLSGLRKVMADLQIEESMKSLAKPRPILKKKGSLGLSTLKSNAPDETDDEDDESTTVSLTDVKQLIIKERSNYERLLILLMQGQEDMLDKEESIIEMREAMDIMANAETEKAKIQANDSKLIMQLSKKLEGLLINLEDMKETNERLNLRLIEFECEKMNKYI